MHSWACKDMGICICITYSDRSCMSVRRSERIELSLLRTETPPPNQEPYSAPEALHAAAPHTSALRKRHLLRQPSTAHVLPPNARARSGTEVLQPCGNQLL